jgi:Uma2 family endonuclease
MSMPSTSEQTARRYLRPPRAIDFPTEEEVPETKRHLEIRTALYMILKHALRDHALIGCDQFVYWDPTDPSECLAPDAFVRLGAADEMFDSWKVWERGAPHLAVEIVSGSDASEALWAPKRAKYHRLGVREVVRFDPENSELRIWDSVEGDLVERVLVEGEPAECVPLGLYWVVAPDNGLEAPLRLSRDKAGKDLLATPVEAERAQRVESDAARTKAEAARVESDAARAKAEAARIESDAGRAKAEAAEEAARAERDVARAESEAALEKVRVLEAELAKRR